MADQQLACPICLVNTPERRHAVGDMSAADCPRCGQYSITGSAAAMLNGAPLTPRQVANASGWIRENQGIELDSRDVDSLRSIRAPTVGERATKMLQEIARRWPQVGASFDFNFTAPIDPSWLAASWSDSGSEVQYLAA